MNEIEILEAKIKELQKELKNLKGNTKKTLKQNIDILEKISKRVLLENGDLVAFNSYKTLILIKNNNLSLQNGIYTTTGVSIGADKIGDVGDFGKYQTIINQNFEQLLQINSVTFLKQLKKIIYCVSKDVSNMSTNSVNLNLTDYKLNFTASDDFRLATTNIEKIANDFKLNIPKKIIDILKKDLIGLNCEIFISRIGNDIKIEYFNREIYFETKTDIYPDWQNIVEHNTIEHIELNKDIFINELKNAIKISKILKIEFENNKYTILASNDVEDYTFTADCINSCNIIFILDTKYLLEMIKPLKGKFINIYHNNNKHGLIKISENEYISILMPLKQK